MASPDVNKNKGVTRPFNILEVLVVQVGDGGGKEMHGLTYEFSVLSGDVCLFS